MDFALSFSVVLPLFLYIGLGVAVGRLRILEGKTVSQINKLVFRVLFPLVMFENVLNAGDALSNGQFTIIGVMAGVVFLHFALLMLLVPLFVKGKPRQGSFIQGSFRGNSLLFALPVVTAICGEENIGIASMCVAVVVPLMNILSVIALESKRGGKVKVLSLLGGILTNPLVIGAAAGLIFYLLGLKLPTVLAKTVKSLTSMVTPLALIALGAGLRFAGIRKDLPSLCAVAVIKLVLAPLLMVTAARISGFSGVPLVSMLALSCVPTAVSSYPMAEQMGADGPFAGEIVAFTTVLSMGTVFIWISLLSGMGWF